MTQPQEYRERSRDYLAKAFQESQNNDMTQASEKGWGAASLMVKAIAEQRGLDHQRHGFLFRVVDNLVRESGDDELNTLFHVANGLHGNFYENWFSARQVESGLHAMERFVDKMETMLEGRS
jgi:hypothetical protein